ncbi:MAG: DUF4386 domain-containing protein [Actinomycetota bacterium]|nr:DUF4386 domain-containing protein [Actinomycetota bacterium]
MKPLRSNLASMTTTNASELKTGGITTLIGTSIWIIGLLVHPTPPEATEPFLRLIAASSHWSQLHYALMISTVFIVGGMALLTRSLIGSGARAIGTLAMWAFGLGGAVFMVGIMVDGIASKALADAWSTSTPAQQQAMFWGADAVVQVQNAMVPVWLSVFLGLAPMLMGIALWISETFPRWLGTWGIAGGAMCLLSGFGPVVHYPIPDIVGLTGATAVVTGWLASGVVMLRAASKATAQRAFTADD